MKSSLDVLIDMNLIGLVELVAGAAVASCKAVQLLRPCCSLVEFQHWHDSGERVVFDVDDDMIIREKAGTWKREHGSHVGLCPPKRVATHAVFRIFCPGV